ncbi:MAG TPA: hypothetical protein VEN47_09635 [Myxococcota bacterium]|nr:hypothetical protein [Myxococcota bacterium]
MAFGTRLRSTLAAALVLATPLPALAGGAETAHPLSLTLKLAGQTTDKAGDDVVGKLTVKSIDVFEGCTGISTPTKTEGLYLFINCADPNSNEIDAVDTSGTPTSPPTLLASVGSVDIGAPVIDTQKAGSTTAVIAPVKVNISCNGGDTTATLFGILNLKFSPLMVGGSCPFSGGMKIVGFGQDPNVQTPDNEFLVNDGSSLSIGKRSSTITTLPVPP